MSEYNLKKMQHKLKKHLDESRFEHTLGVRYTSAALAMRYSCSMEKAEVAGLLHDCAKCMTDEKKLKICKKHDLEVRPVELENPFLLHAKAGACLAKEKYEVEDEDILGAITYHTTGKPAMSLLEKIVFVADYIEPHRSSAPNLEEIRRLAFEDLDEAVYVILRDTLHYLGNKSKETDPMTRISYEYYRDLFDPEERSD